MIGAFVSAGLIVAVLVLGRAIFNDDDWKSGR